MKAYINVKCPHCAFKFKQETQFSNSNQQEIACCPLEEGGCDNRFIISFYFKPIVSTATVNDFEEIE